MYVCVVQSDRRRQQTDEKNIIAPEKARDHIPTAVASLPFLCFSIHAGVIARSG